MRSVVAVGVALVAACVGAVGSVSTSQEPAWAAPTETVEDARAQQAHPEDTIVVDGQQVPLLAEFQYKPRRAREARGVKNPECVLRIYDFVDQERDDSHTLIMPVQTRCAEEVKVLGHTVRLHYQQMQRGWRAVVGSTGAYDFWRWDEAFPWEAQGEDSSDLTQSDATVECHRFDSDRPQEWGGQAQGSVMFGGVEWVAYGYTAAADIRMSGCAVSVNF